MFHQRYMTGQQWTNGQPQIYRHLDLIYGNFFRYGWSEECVPFDSIRRLAFVSFLQPQNISFQHYVNMVRYFYYAIYPLDIHALLLFIFIPQFIIAFHIYPSVSIYSVRKRSTKAFKKENSMFNIMYSEN